MREDRPTERERERREGSNDRSCFVNRSRCVCSFPLLSVVASFFSSFLCPLAFYFDSDGTDGHRSPKKCCLIEWRGQTVVAQLNETTSDLDDRRIARSRTTKVDSAAGVERQTKRQVRPNVVDRVLVVAIRRQRRRRQHTAPSEKRRPAGTNAPRRPVRTRPASESGKLEGKRESGPKKRDRCRRRWRPPS